MANERLGLLRIDKSGAPGQAPSKGKRRWLYILLALAGLTGAYFLIGGKSAGQSVELGTASLQRPSQALVALNASGYVVAQRKASVAAKTTGRLVWLGVEEGSKVKADEVLAKLDSDDVKAASEKAKGDLDSARHALEEAKAELDNAAINHSRMQALVGQHIISRNDYDTAKARLSKAQAAFERAKANIEAAKAALRQAEVYREYTLLRAPFDGVVLTKNADVGDIVTPLGAAANAKASVVTLADMTSLVVEADVSESHLAKVKMDGPCEISLDSIPGERFPGRVHMIVPTADRSKATVLVKVRFDSLDPRVLPEMSAKVGFLTREATPAEREAVLSVPAKAVLKREGRDVVFAVTPEMTAKEVEVKVLQSGPEFVSISGEIKPGDKVVLAPEPGLASGSKLKLKEK